MQVNPEQLRRKMVDRLNATQTVLHFFATIAALWAFFGLFAMQDLPFMAPAAGAGAGLLFYTAGQTHKEPLTSIVALVALLAVHPIVGLYLAWSGMVDADGFFWFIIGAFELATIRGLYAAVRGKLVKDKYFPEKIEDDRILDA